MRKIAGVFIFTICASSLCLSLACQQAFAQDVSSGQASQLPPLAPVIQPDGAANQAAEPSQNSAAQDTNSAQFSADLSALENKFYSHDFAGEPVEKRLNRLERLVFGAAKTGPVQDRITQLLLEVPLAADPQPSAAPAVSAQPNTTVPAQPDTAAPANEPAIKGPSAHWSLQGDVTSMEKQVFGKTYTSDTLTNRVSRLETAVFAGQPAQTFMPMQMRINKLMSTLRPQFSAPKNYYAGKPITGTYSNSKNDEEKKKGHPFWHKVGTVLGDVGRVAAEGAVSMAASSMMYGGYGYGGYGYGGYSGYGPYGYGGGFPGGYW